MKKTKVTWIVILAVASLIVAVASLAVSTVQARYTVRGVDASYQWSNTYQVNQSASAIETKKHWTSGKVYYGVNQKSGTVKTKYSIYYKKNNGKYILEYDNGYTSKNNTYYGEFFAHSTNGKDKYSYKLMKNSNKNVKSQMLIDLFVL
ncbi:hypothetical protein PGRAN_14402 [Listeria grandensis FSL F6-0971]|uniref:Uncharacterized protein n=1 Tax=Listeria grandensis FSL F6-0971 TaxID=1265819 RepID=W7B6L6_9LIST|nr:hypothetical protein [Listeria grandensis]EUJ20615.1 hypothetical protein PGRAN_14402 [Listeria grandensis FSL F6-0971]